MSEIYNPTGEVGSSLKRATSAEAATGTAGDEYLRTNFTRIADRIRYLDDSGLAMVMGRLGSYSAGDTTPTVAGVSVLRIVNASPTTISGFDDGVNGQLLILKFDDANTTINRTNAYLAGGVNYVSGVDDTLVLFRLAGAWYELCRSTNA